MKVEWFVGEGLPKYGSKQIKKYTQWKNLVRLFFLPARNFLFVASKEIKDSTVK